jgi:LacI family transcriptional regulator
MPKNGKGTLLDIARRCDVSQSTVSRVLSNSRKGRFSVSEEVRQRILSVAEELAYRPSMAARNLTASKTKLVAILGLEGIYSDRIGPVEEAVTAMAESLDRAGYEICVSFPSKRHSAFALPPLRVDGIVAVGASRLSDLDPLDESGIPYVSLNGLSGTRGSSVSPDDARGTYLALKHLYDLGHRRISYLDHWSVDAVHPSVIERRNAFVHAASDLGFHFPQLNIPMLPALTAWDSYYEPFVREAILQGRATAVLAYSHQGALGLIRAAYELGLRVPRDFSVVCFNNEPVVKISIPSLTAVDVPSVKMGQMSAEILLRAMASLDDGTIPQTPVHVRLDESLVVRESSAPPPVSG